MLYVYHFVINHLSSSYVDRIIDTWIDSLQMFYLEYFLFLLVQIFHHKHLFIFPRYPTSVLYRTSNNPI